jgi:preprotein translocase subunit SecD
MEIISNKRRIDFMAIRHYAYILSAILLGLSVYAWISRGEDKYGIDFRGGSIIELQAKGPQADAGDVRARLSDLNLGDVQVQQFGSERELLVRIESQGGGDNAEQSETRSERAKPSRSEAREQRSQAREQSSNRGSENREQRAFGAQRSERSQANQQGTTEQIRARYQARQQQTATTRSGGQDSTRNWRSRDRQGTSTTTQAQTNWRERERRVRTIPDTTPTATQQTSRERSAFRDRLPADLRSTAGPEFDSLPFRSLYLTDDEWAAEAANATKHGVLHVGRVEDPAGGFRAHRAVLVKPNGVLGSAYMTAIRPFRHLVVYPPLLREMGRAWPAGARA